MDDDLPDDYRPDDKFWRQEVVSRVQQHRARRRRRFDPHASLELDFQAGMDSYTPEMPEMQLRPPRPVVKTEAPKIIEFPRPASLQPVASLHPVYVPQERLQPSADLELAEPMIESPRILDAPEPPPEQMDLLPAFADIQLEAEENRRTGRVDLPLQPAALGYRLFAGLVDLAFVLMASALFVAGFVIFVGRMPQSRSSLLCALLVSGGLWLIYQYLFLVYSSATPGMQLAQLEICTFQGSPASVKLRRWRALASFLSALAAGLGFAWALVDEDTLGWHDRITQTHLRKSSH
jgi:uncharacterized RDD family membrane protein YckC